MSKTDIFALFNEAEDGRDLLEVLEMIVESQPQLETVS